MKLSRPIKGTVIAVMVVWNGKPFLRDGISSVLKALRPEDDLLVVDNNSTDGGYEFLCDQFPSVAVLQTGANLGGAGGFNAGAKLALESNKCKYIWLLDNDIKVESDCLLPLLTHINNHPNCAAAGSQICLYNNPEIIQEAGANYSPWLGNLITLHTGQKRLPAQTQAYQVDYLAACSLLIRADVVRSHGLFKNFFVFYDDVEWGLRIKKLGWQLWAVPSSVIYHNFSNLKPLEPWREYYRKRNKAVVLALHPPNKGKFFAFWLFLFSLFFRMHLLQLYGNTSLYQAHKLAIDDLLAGRLGARDFNKTINVTSEVVGDLYNFLIAVHRPGDALAAIQEIIKLQPQAKFGLANKNLNIIKEQIPIIDEDHHCRTKMAVVIDHHINAHLLFRYSTIYRFHLGELQIINNPKKEYLLQWIRYLIAICYGAWHSSIQFLKVYRFYQRQERNGLV